MKRIRIEITSADIANGRPQASYDCPFALALARRLGGTRVSVVTTNALVYGEGIRPRQLIASKAIVAAITAFDLHSVLPKPGFYYYTEAQ